MAEAETAERSAGRRVEVGRPFPGQVGEEDQTLAAGGHVLGLRQHRVVVDLREEGVVEPGQGAGCRQHHSHHQPPVRRGVAEGVDPTLAVRQEAVRRSQHHPGGPEDDRQRAGASDPPAHGGSGLVAGTGGHRHTLEAPHDIAALAELGKPRRRDLQLGEKLVAPAALGDVEEERPRGIGHVDAMPAGEPIAHVVLGQGDLPDAGVGRRLVLPHPEQLGGGEAGQGAVAGEPDETIAAASGLQRGALRRGALIVPEDRRADHLPAGVEAHQPVHLAGEADTEDLGHLGLEAVEHRPGPRHPHVGMLL